MLRLLTFGFILAVSVAAEAAEPWYVLRAEDHTCQLATSAGRGLRTPAEARLTFRNAGVIGEIKTLPEGSDQPFFVAIEVHIPLGSTMWMHYTRGLAVCQRAVAIADQEENLVGLK